MKTLDQRLQILEDKDEIRELTARYCYAVVAQDGDALLDMFASDGEFHMGTSSWRDQAELSKLYKEQVGAIGPKPFIQNHVVQVNGDTATGNCAVEIRVIEKGESVTACGHYDDNYRRVNGKWKFAKRVFHLYHWAKLSEGWAGKTTGPSLK